MSRVVLNIRVSDPNIILYNRLVPVQTYYGVGEFLCVNSDFDADYMASLSIFGMCNGEVDCHLELRDRNGDLIDVSDSLMGVYFEDLLSEEFIFHYNDDTISVYVKGL